MKYLEVIGDCNDGDFIRSKTLVTDKEISDIVEILKITGTDWNTRTEYDEDELATLIYADKLTDKQFSLMDKFMPTSEIGMHTIEDITVTETIPEINLI